MDDVLDDAFSNQIPPIRPLQGAPSVLAYHKTCQMKSPVPRHPSFLPACFMVQYSYNEAGFLPGLYQNLDRPLLRPGWRFKP